MKGLLIKDFKLVKGQKSFFAFILVISVGIAAFTDNLSFMVCFLPFVFSLFTISTISYDEFDNGNAFLFTLPISRTGYAVEKYCLALLLGGGAWIFAVLLAAVFGILRDIASFSDIAVSAVMVLPVLLLIQTVMLPFQLKFGGEKGRIALIGSIGLVFLIGIVIVKAAQLAGIDIADLFDHLPTVSMGVMAAALILASFLLLLVSLRISIAIMKKKEF